MASWFWLSGGLAVICFMFFLFCMLNKTHTSQQRKEEKHKTNDR